MENKNEQQVPEIMPEPIEEPKKSKKGQMAKGVACGIAGTILVGFVALNVVTKITGTKIYITNATAKMLGIQYWIQKQFRRSMN